MTPVLDQIEIHAPVLHIGGVSIALRTGSAQFARMVEDRYTGFVTRTGDADLSFDVELFDPYGSNLENASRWGTTLEDPFEEPPNDLRVTCENQVWRIHRGDFDAWWNPQTGRGHIRQTVNPYSLDSVLRIVHSLVLAQQGEFLIHAASAIRNGRAFLFSGVSGAGKTTISRLAPADTTLLTDEISYVRKNKTRENVASYRAHGTPFAGELARLGTNCSAPLDTLFMLAQGPENRIEAIHPVEATQMILRNILFFARDADLVQCVFEAACRFVERVPIRRLTFRPDVAVWDLIGRSIQ